MSIVETALAKIRATTGVGPAVPSPLRATAPVAQLQDGGAAVLVSKASLPHGTIMRPPRRRVIVDRNAMRAAGLLAPETAERRTAQEYRHIKRPLVQGAAVAGGNVIMVGSAFPGDGKSFTCINLALSLSLEKDWSVILVDCDLIKPQLSRLFGVGGEPGLTEILNDAALDIEQLIIDTDIPGLAVLPAGQRDDNTTELLASARMGEVVQLLASGFEKRLLLFDSPPLLHTSEASVLAGFMGQVVLVVAANRTPQAAVTETINLLGTPEKIKLVLNMAERGRMGRYYGYGYYEAVARQE
jgi:protein-tyrosine kinase